MRIAFHTPRASHLEPGPSGDAIFVEALVAGLRERGHELEVVSRVDVRDYGRGRRPAHGLAAEAASVRRRMQRFAPDAWLVYGASATYPDLWGWWLRPRRYVLVATGIGKPELLRRPWRSVFPWAHRRSLARADAVTACRPATREPLRALGVRDDRLHVLQAREAGLNGRVRLAGDVERRDVAWYYAACDFLARPTLRDALPELAVLEAQACGRPVVTTRTRSAELTVDENRTGLLAADGRELEAQLATLAGDRVLCRWMGIAARDYVERRHSMSVRLRQIEELLEGEAEPRVVALSRR